MPLEYDQFSERYSSKWSLRKLKRTTGKTGICCKTQENYMQSQLFPLANCVISHKSKANQYLPTTYQTLYYKMRETWWTRQTQLQPSRSIYSRIHSLTFESTGLLIYKMGWSLFQPCKTSRITTWDNEMTQRVVFSFLWLSKCKS